MPDIFITPEEVKPEEKKEEVKEISQSSHQILNDHSTDGVSTNSLSSYILKPKEVDFETREAKEKIILLLRQHPIVNLKWFLPVVLMVILPSVVSHYSLLSFMPGGFRLILLLFWYLLIASISLLGFLNWYFNVELITDERIIDVDFYNLIYKEVSDANIDKVQDVTYKMGGIFRNLFNYGDVYIQTASEVPNFDFLSVPHPDKVAKLLQDLKMEEQQEALEGKVR
jgi:membrane protein YdbS with pleckstrin-like domain